MKKMFVFFNILNSYFKNMNSDTLLLRQNGTSDGWLLSSRAHCTTFHNKFEISLPS